MAEKSNEEIMKEIKSFSSEQKLDFLISTMLNMKEQVSGFKTYKEETDATLASHENDITDLQECMSNLQMRVNILEARDRKKSKIIQEMKDRHTSQVMKSMENNIVIYRVAEASDESYNTLVQTTKTFFTDEMKIPEEVLSKVEIIKLHRLGGVDSTRKAPRPIVLAVSPHSRRTIFKYIKNLDKDKFGISGQYPSEVQEIRFALKDKIRNDPDVKDAESIKLVNDKLYVDGDLYQIPETASNVAPEQYCTADVNYNREVPHIAEQHGQTILGSSFRPFVAKITSRREAQMVLDVFDAKMRDDVPTHTVYAYRFQEGGRVVQYRSDDGEHGAGRNVLRALQKSNLDSHMIVIARWYGGRDLGKKRLMDTYYQITKDAAKASEPES